MLTVCIDFKSPYAFVAHELIWQLEAQSGYKVDWQPLTLNIGSFLGRAEKRDDGQVVDSNRTPKQWSVVKAAYREARCYAENQGRVLRGPLKIWDSSKAGIALIWAQDHAVSRAQLKGFMTDVFDRFWQRECDIEDLGVLSMALSEAGIQNKGFINYAQGAGQERHDLLQDQLLTQGVFGVPSFIVSDEIFFGREHLETVIWRLNGGEGAMPFVRYPWRSIQALVAPGAEALTVDILVDLNDPESVVGIKAVAEWARGQGQAVRVLPFLREPINTAAEVPRGAPDFEAYKARRGLARRCYKDQEQQRNLQRLSLHHAWQFTNAGSILIHWGLLRLAEQGVGATTVSAFVLALVSSSKVLDRACVEAALLNAMPALARKMRAFDQAAAETELAEGALALSLQGVLSAPSMMYQTDVFSGMAHLPRLTALCRS